MMYVHDHGSVMKFKHSIVNLRSTRTVYGSGRLSTDYPGRMHLASLCGPSTTASIPSLPRKGTSSPYRVPPLTKWDIGNIIHFDDDVVFAIHVGQILSRRYFLGYPGDIAFDYEDVRS